MCRCGGRPRKTTGAKIMASSKVKTPNDLGEELALTKTEESEPTERDESADEEDERKRRRARRWGTRTEAMIYGRLGSTKLNDLMQARKIIAKKNGVKVVVDLDSIDDY